MSRIIALSFLLIVSVAWCAEDGFVPLFDGKSLDGWEGDEKVFRVEDGAIVAGSLDKDVPRNEFLCTRKKYENFELRLKVKLEGPGDNAGVQFRTNRISNPPNEVSGYQADMGEGYWGALYDESRRNKILAAPSKETIAKILKRGDWNDYTIRAMGNTIELSINGTKTVEYVEEDDKIDTTGVIALQIHGGKPSQASYKDIRIAIFEKK